MDWNQQVVIPEKSAGKAAGFRKLIFAVLWVESHIIYLAVAFILALTWLVRMLVRRRKRKHTKRLLIISSMGSKCVFEALASIASVSLCLSSYPRLRNTLRDRGRSNSCSISSSP